MATEYAYQPLLPAMSAVTGGAHRLAADRSTPLRARVRLLLRSGYAFLAGMGLVGIARSQSLRRLRFLAYFTRRNADPELRIGSGSHWGALRLNNLVCYGEAPHNVALAMLPLAYLFLHRAIVRGGAWNMVLAGVISGAVALTNAFGAYRCGARRDRHGAGARTRRPPRTYRGALFLSLDFALAAAVAHRLDSPQRMVRRRFFPVRSARQTRHPGRQLLAFGLIWWLTRRLKSSFERFVCLSRRVDVRRSAWILLVQSPDHRPAIQPLPTRTRNGAVPVVRLRIQLGLARIAPVAGRVALAVIFAAVGLRQAANFREFASVLVHPIDITKTIEYKVDTWIDANLPGSARHGFRRSRVHLQSLLGQSPNECRPRTHRAQLDAARRRFHRSTQA